MGHHAAGDSTDGTGVSGIAADAESSVHSHDAAGKDELRVGATVVARYEGGGSLHPTWSPRPYLHPVRTMSGTTVTEACPPDHRWHLGVSVGLQDVNKSNFWGGRTYVRDRGYQWRPDHGHVRRDAWLRRDPGHLAERLEWIGHDGAVLLHEHRSLRASDVPFPGAWRLDVEFALENVTGGPVELGSPATNGRERAGYGGLFWRLPPCDGSLGVFTAEAAGEEAVHGSVTGWLAVTGTDPHGRPWSLLLAHGGATPWDPWFVRVRDYPGAGASLAWSEPVVLDPGDTAGRSFRAVIVDERADGAAQAERWLRLAGASPRADAGLEDGE
jgi:hypothetical protein